ncbi:DUF5067 domain-containing protein [Listeria sp. PSOL-1]|uniref:DUF5067 domain-containing protein n=1 Tax=Listeria sp. PSOL-1 TaxID=1844999 RepID=UPI0013D84760|nr:DUF5067 domain-containing protein [Listeria sp. PSOL-1]
MNGKLLVTVGSIAFLSVGLVACGNSETKKQNQDDKTETVAAPKAEAKDEVQFKNDVLKISLATIKLTGSEVLPPNKDYGEDKSSLVITYEFTNTSKKPLEPSTVFIACFKATQKTDATIEDLGLAVAPQEVKYEKMNAMANIEVQPGKTVQAVISYSINDTKKPVKLNATQGIGGKKLGSKTYKKSAAH